MVMINRNLDHLGSGSLVEFSLLKQLVMSFLHFSNSSSHFPSTSSGSTLDIDPEVFQKLIHFLM